MGGGRNNLHLGFRVGRSEDEARGDDDDGREEGDGEHDESEETAGRYANAFRCARQVDLLRAVQFWQGVDLKMNSITLKLPFI